MTHLDLHPAARRMAELVRNVADDQLTAPTPCAEYTLGDLIDHVNGLAFAFEAAARKDPAVGDQVPSADAARLGDDWRERIPAYLDALAAAWLEPDAWTGMTKAGGIDLPGELAGIIALNELVVHGWDVAKASGQPYTVDEPSLAAAHEFTAQFSGAGQEALRHDMYGPVVEVPDDAPLLDQLIGMAGRDPSWSPPTS